jgi:hypothetical protein
LLWTERWANAFVALVVRQYRHARVTKYRRGRHASLPAVLLHSVMFPSESREIPPISRIFSRARLLRAVLNECNARNSWLTYFRHPSHYFDPHRLVHTSQCLKVSGNTLYAAGIRTVPSKLLAVVSTDLLTPG